MAHPQQLDFICNFRDLLYNKEKSNKLDILEIGSYVVNASIRDFFNSSNYLGIDLLEGPGVDLVLNGENIKKLNKKFDVIISSECFEHAINWKNIFKAMIDCTKEDGYVAMTCASKGRYEHGTTRSNFFDTAIYKYKVDSSPGTKDEYYKNLTRKDFLKNFDIKKIFQKYFFFYNIHSFDLYFMGQKKNSDEDTLIYDLEKKVINDNNKKPSFRSVKRYILHTLLPEKICNDLHFMNLKRLMKQKI